MPTLSFEGETHGAIIRGNIIECNDEKSVGIRIGEKVGGITMEDNEIMAARQELDNRIQRGKEEKK